MKKYLLVVLATILALTLAAPAFASVEHHCEHDATTIESLHHCVEHAAEMGHITKPGVANALLATLNAGHLAYDEGNTTAAVNTLNAFIAQVNAQSGKSIDAEHGAHLVGHALMILDSLAN